MSATAADFYRELVAWGFSVATDGEQLLVSPRDRITDQLRQRIRASKADLLRLLSDPSPPPLTPEEQQDITEAQARRIVKVYRVLVAMDDGHAPRWVTMLGASDDDDARRSAGNTFTPERVLRIEEQS